MMQFIKPHTKINFVGRRKYAYVFSAALLLITVVSLVYHGGPRYGVDFAGGTEIQVKFEQKVDIDNIKTGLDNMELGGASVQRFGGEDDNEYLIRTDVDSISTGAVESETISEAIQKTLVESTGSGVDIRRIEMVGPQVGKDLRENALLAIFFALLLIAVYISGRFEHRWNISALMAIVLGFGVYGLKTLLALNIPALILIAVVITLVLFFVLKLKFAMGAIVSELHDIIITVGILSIFNVEFSLTTIAAILTIVGYSLNDTIIVFDRIRENLRKSPNEGIGALINRSINETLSRTILTSGTTLLVLLSLFFLGGSTIHDFAFTLIVGVIIGTYSSIFVAAPVLLIWSKFDQKLNIGKK